MRKAFTLTELMVVVAIIAMITAIAIPNLIASRDMAQAAQAATTPTAKAPYAAAVLIGHWGPNKHTRVLFEWTDPKTGQRVLIADGQGNAVALLALDIPIPAPATATPGPVVESTPLER